MDVCDTGAGAGRSSAGRQASIASKPLPSTRNTSLIESRLSASLRGLNAGVPYFKQGSDQCRLSSVGQLPSKGRGFCTPCVLGSRRRCSGDAQHPVGASTYLCSTSETSFDGHVPTPRRARARRARPTTPRTVPRHRSTWHPRKKLWRHRGPRALLTARAVRAENIVGAERY